MKLDNGVYVIKIKYDYLVTVMQDQQHWFDLHYDYISANSVMKNDEYPWDKEILSITKLEKL